MKMRSLIGKQCGKVSKLQIMTNIVCHVKVLKLLPHVINVIKCSHLINVIKV